MSFSALRAIFFLFFFIQNTNALASIGDTFGFSSRSSSLAGAMVGSFQDGASVYQNPSSLTQTQEDPETQRLGLIDDQKRFSFHWSLLYMNPSFKPIQNVIVENNYTSDQLRYSDVDTHYPSLLGQSLGMSYQFKKSALQWSLGLLIFLPVDELALLDSGETYIPEYVLYRSKNKKPESHFGFGFQPISQLSLGVGMHLGASIRSNTTVFLQTDPNKTSSMRVAAGLKTKVSPYFGAQYRWNSKNTSGWVLRLPLNQNETIHVQTSARAIGGIAALDFNFSALATAYYEPLSVEVGHQWTIQNHHLFLQLDFQRWSHFSAPSLLVEESEVQSGGIQFSSGKKPTPPYKDLWIPRVGYEKDFNSWTGRVGYAYRPSIVKNPPTEAGNVIDPNEHRLSAGAGFRFKKFLDFNAPCRIDFHLAYHLLSHQKINKTPGDEQGSGAGDQKIGAPGFETGGHLWGGGVTLNLFL